MPRLVILNLKCQKFRNLKVILRISVPSSVLFWTETESVGVIFLVQKLQSLVLPITTGDTLAFTFHIFSSSSFSPWYLPGFSYFIFLMFLSFRKSNRTLALFTIFWRFYYLALGASKHILSIFFLKSSH